MATTTNYGWTTPDNTALVKDGASAIRALGTAIDTSMNTALGTKKAGMVLLNTTSYSAVASQSFNDVFSSTYDNYAIVFTNTNSNSVMLNLRFRVSGADNTAASYAYQHLTVDGTTVTGARSLAQTSINVYNQNSTSLVTGVIDVFSPNLAAQTQLKIRSAMYGNSTDGAFYHVSSTVFTGFTLYPTSNTMTGTVSVYGYNK